MNTYRHLLISEYGKYSTFLKSLDDETLFSFFGVYTKHEVIDELVFSIRSKPLKHKFIVAQDENFKWIGIIHIALGEKNAELGIIVRPENRRQGIANELITQAILWCRNREYLDIYMHCISRNTAIMNLVTKHNLKIDREYTEADARITLPQPSLISLMREQAAMQIEWIKSIHKLSYGLNYFNGISGD